MKKRALLLAFGFALTISGYTYAAGCPNTPNAQKFVGLAGNILSLFGGKPPCGSVGSVLNKLEHGSASGGRRLEEEKPFDPKKAQEEMNTALQDPALQGRFDEIDKLTSEPDTRLVLKAVVLDDEGDYLARDLLIQKIKQ